MNHAARDTIIPLPDWRALRVTGNDRVTFLQGQLTQDIEALKTRGSWAGWADAKGRLLWAGPLLSHADSLWLVVPAAQADALARRLSMFVLRADVSVAVAPGAVCGIPGHEGAPWQVSADEGGCRMTLPGDPGRVLLIGGQATAEDSDGVEDWRLADIRAGLPWIRQANAGEFVPQMVNLDLVGGISFTKGCYVGQEVVARTHNLGRIKRRMFRYRCAAPLEPGAALYSGETKAGTVVDAVTREDGTELLAVARLGEESALCAGRGGEQPLEILPLPYEVPGLGADT